MTTDRDAYPWPRAGRTRLIGTTRALDLPGPPTTGEIRFTGPLDECYVRARRLYGAARFVHVLRPIMHAGEDRVALVVGADVRGIGVSATRVNRPVAYQ